MDIAAICVTNKNKMLQQNTIATMKQIEKSRVEGYDVRSNGSAPTILFTRAKTDVLKRDTKQSILSFIYFLE
jgi:hypothetical protein